MKPITQAARLEARLRAYVPSTYAPVDVVYDAADHIRDTEAELQMLRARVEHAETRLTRVLALLEPQQWAENSRNRTALLEAIVGAPQLTVIEGKAA